MDTFDRLRELQNELDQVPFDNEKETRRLQTKIRDLELQLYAVGGRRRPVRNYVAKPQVQLGA